MGVIRGVGLNNDILGTILLVRFLGFAGYIDIIGRTTAKECESYIRPKREAARIELRINGTKTKYLLAGNSDHLRSSELVDGAILAIVKELGTVVTSDSNISSETRRSIVQGNRAYYGLYRLLRYKRL